MRIVFTVVDIAGWRVTGADAIAQRLVAMQTRTVLSMCRSPSPFANGIKDVRIVRGRAKLGIDMLTSPVQLALLARDVHNALKVHNVDGDGEGSLVVVVDGDEE